MTNAELKKYLKEKDELLKAVITDDRNLELRRILSNEAESHRLFLERQIKMIVGFVGAIVATVTFTFILFFGKTSSEAESRVDRYVKEAKERLGEEISSRVVDYQVADEYEKRIAIHAATYVEGTEFRNLLERKVAKAAERVVAQFIVDQMTELVQKSLEAELAKLQESDARDIVERALSELSRLREEFSSVDKRLSNLEKHQNEANERNYLDLRYDFAQACQKTRGSFIETGHCEIDGVRISLQEWQQNMRRFPQLQ